MSDTRRHVQPGWNPSHRRWPARFGDMSEKLQTRDRAPRGLRSNHRFSAIGRNSLGNLRAKNEALALAERLDEDCLATDKREEP